MRELAATTLADFAAAPFRVVLSRELPATPDAVFAVLAEPAAWLAWFPLMHRAAWCAGSPAGGIGAEREVALRALGRYRERMIAWQPGERFAFTMTATSSPLVARMAEDWQLAPADGGAATRLTWTVAATPSALGRAATPILRQVLAGLFRRGGAKLGRQLAARGTPAPR